MKQLGNSVVPAQIAPILVAIYKALCEEITDARRQAGEVAKG